MDEDNVARRLAGVGSALLRSKPHAFTPTLLVAEVEDMRAAASIYKVVAGQTVYVFPDNGALLLDRLLYLWAAWEPDDRWWTIEYLLRDGAFDVAYRRSDRHNPEGDDAARRAAVERAFGNQPVRYPPGVVIGETYPRG